MGTEDVDFANEKYFIFAMVIINDSDAATDVILYN